MSEIGYLTWLIATAVMIILVLVVGTLGAAGMLGRDAEAAPVESESRPRSGIDQEALR